MAEKKKNPVLIHLEYAGFMVLYGAFRLLPIRAARNLAGVLMKLLWLVDAKHRNRSILHVSHSGIVGTREEAVRIARRSMQEFGWLLAEIIKADQLYSHECVNLRASESILNLVLPCRNPGSRQGIIVTAHFGNWEIAGRFYSEQSQTPMFSMMRPFSNPLIGEKILAHRRSATHILIDKHQGIRPVLKALQEGRTASILIDQHASSREGVECIFFGHPARVHMTPALLHLKTGIPIISEVTVRDPERPFHFTLEAGKSIRYTPTGDKEKDIRIVTQMCITALEKLIRKHPEQWLWAPRHWLDIERRQAAEYANWKAPDYLQKVYDDMMAEPEAPSTLVDFDGNPIR